MWNACAARRMLLTVVALTLAGVSTMATVDGARAEEPVLVFAAASLKNALDAVVGKWRTDTGKAVMISYAGSSALARQIQQGAPSDIFVSANVDWMDRLEAEQLIKPETRRDLLGNRLVLIAAGKDAAKVDIKPGFDLLGLLDGQRLAMALVDAVPAGIYGKQALTELGLWDAVEPRVAQLDNVRAALAWVARGEAPYGIVYATDAAVENNVAVVGTFPADSHEPIIYPAALMASSESRDAPAFLEYLSATEARKLFEQFGFTVLE
jgi:molybdate transport system substrate-binding protein